MELLESLNDYAGLLSLLAVVAAIIVPILIYKKEQRNARQEAQDELDAIESTSSIPMSIEEKQYFSRKSYLSKRAKK